MPDWLLSLIAIVIPIIVTWIVNRRMNSSLIKKTQSDTKRIEADTGKIQIDTISTMQETIEKMADQQKSDRKSIEELRESINRYEGLLDEYKVLLSKEIEKRKNLEKDNLKKDEQIRALQKQISEIVRQHDLEREQLIGTIDQLTVKMRLLQEEKEEK